jgi:hypothetical protein
LENEDDAEEAMVTGRLRGAKNYSHGELELLVACMKEIAPITSQDFAAVAELYNCLANEKGFTTCGAAPLRQRFEKVRETHVHVPHRSPMILKLQKTKPDDGNPQNKKLYEAAKAITLVSGPLYPNNYQFTEPTPQSTH